MNDTRTPPMLWGEHLATGHPLVDEDHRGLIQLINAFSDAIDAPDEATRIDEAVRGLCAYAGGHFMREEAIMAQAGIDERHASTHARAHQGFVDYVNQVRQARKPPIEVVQFLKRWLNLHILGVDHAMARQIRMIEAGMTPAEAFDAEMQANKDPAMSILLQAMGNGEAAAPQQDGRAGSLIEQIMDSNPVATFVIDADHRVTHWNHACAIVTGVAARDIIGTKRQWAAFYTSERPVMADLIVSGALDENVEEFYPGIFRRSPIIPFAYEAESFFPQLGDGGVWLHFRAAPLRDPQGRMIGAVECLLNTTDRHRAEDALREHQKDLEATIATRTAELAQANLRMAEDILRQQAAEAELLQRYAEVTELNGKLQNAQEQLVQSEKLASIGLLAAGVAHEINNPIGYVHSNIGSLETYLRQVFSMLGAYAEAEKDLPDATRARLGKLKQEYDIEFLTEDVPTLMRESKEGIRRVKKIVQDLKDFSHVDSATEWQVVDLHKGIDSTLNIVNNEIKYKADVIKEFGVLPEVECMPSQINQVVMNLAVNAAHAMGEQRGKITVRTGTAGENVWIEVADTGSGIPEDIRQKIFDPFFTTKPVGKGTGLGLSLSYGIIQKHHGSIEVESEVGKGTTFRITLPIKRPSDDDATA
ncbi:ATP-binding protein [Aquabacterium sp.]|uniref:ATP-binding protein n=1 Tax=Aquabacterium sp. TaxID=1872578 RepID=UPI0035B0E34A